MSTGKEKEKSHLLRLDHITFFAGLGLCTAAALTGQPILLYLGVGSLWIAAIVDLLEETKMFKAS